MPPLNRSQFADLRGAGLMIVDALAGISRIVEDMHTTIQRRPLPLGAQRTRPARGITGFVYRSVHGGIRLAGAGADALLAPLGRLAPPGARSPAHEAMVAAVNGVHGDYLARTGNPLAIDMALRLRGQPVDAADPAAGLAAAGSPGATPRLVVLVHGLCMSDLQWRRDGHDHGEALARDLGCSVLYLHYNSGRHIHENGRQLAALLDTLVANWPVALDELAIVGHSMGGLVARSACTQAAAAGLNWLERTRMVICLGSPHLGSPVERLGELATTALGLSAITAPLGQIAAQRSQGIQDLRHGLGPPTQTANHIAWRFVGGSVADDPDDPLGEIIGDGLVTLSSATAHELTGDVDSVRLGGVGHMELIKEARVYRRILAWLKAGPGLSRRAGRRGGGRG